ncbi:MAG: hypothetical protein H6843_00705 [Rhodospirillaceae bacterium]|nr:hypothetical protein [Rhodospirillaceae bacterium]
MMSRRPHLFFSALAVTLLAMTAGAPAQTPIGPWMLACIQTTTSAPMCAAEQSVGTDGSAVVLRATPIGFTIELLLGPDRGSPSSVAIYRSSQPIAQFGAGRLSYIGRDGAVRRFRLSGTNDVRHVLQAMTSATVLAVAVDYADGRSETFNLRTAESSELFAAIHQVVPF